MGVWHQIQLTYGRRLWRLYQHPASGGGAQEAGTIKSSDNLTPSAGTDHRALDDDAGGGIPLQGDEELAREGNDGRFAYPRAKAPDPLAEPQAERRGRLVL